MSSVLQQRARSLGQLDLPSGRRAGSEIHGSIQEDMSDPLFEYVRDCSKRLSGGEIDTKSRAITTK